MNGYREYFDNGEKNLSFTIENDTVLVKYNKIWKKIKKTLDIKFHSKVAYHEKNIKAKVKTFNGVVNAVFWNDEIPKENVQHCCTAYCRTFVNL